MNGWIALPEGLAFPITHGYVTIGQLGREGAVGTITVGGLAYGVYLHESHDDRH